MLILNWGQGEGGGSTGPDFGQVCVLAEPKSRPITWEKFFIEKHQKLIKVTRIYCSLQVQNVQIFLIFIYNQSKIFLILPITRGARVYLVSTGKTVKRVRTKSG